MLGFERTLCNRNENYTMKNVCEYGLLVERIHSVVIFFCCSGHLNRMKKMQKERKKKCTDSKQKCKQRVRAKRKKGEIATTTEKTRDDTVLGCCVSMVQRDEIVNVPVCWNSLRARGTLFLSLQFHVLVHSRMPAAFHYPLRLSLPCCPFFLLFSFLQSSLPFCAHQQMNAR